MEFLSMYHIYIWTETSIGFDFWRIIELETIESSYHIEHNGKLS